VTRGKPTTPAARHAVAVSAEFKLDEADHFLQRAGSSHGSPREFRYEFDAAVEAVHSARDLTRIAIGRDQGMRTRFNASLRASQAYESIESLRNKTHHEGDRAPLREEVRGRSPMLITSVHIDPIEPNRGTIVLDDKAPAGVVSRKWIIEFEGKNHDAVATCREAVEVVRSLLSEFRGRSVKGR